MNALQNMKTGLKLTLGFGVLALVVIGMAGAGFMYLNASNQRLLESFSDGTLPMEYVDSLDEAFLVMRGDTYKYLVLTSAADHASIRAEITRYIDQFNKSLDNYASTANSSKIEAEVFAPVRQQWADFQKGLNNVLAAEDAGNHDAALQSLQDGEFHIARSTLQATMDKIRSTNLDINQTRYEENETAFGQAVTLIIVESIVGLLLAILAGYLVGRSIVVPLSRVAQVAQGIATGKMDLSTQVDIHTHEEVGAVAAAFNQMTERLREILNQEREQTEYLQKAIDDYSGVMAQVSSGDLAVRLDLHPNGRGESDPLFVLGRNLNDMIGNLSRMIAQIRDASSNLTTAAAEILAATTQQASGASEQSSSIAQTTTTVGEVKAIGESAVVRAQEVVEASNRTVEVSRSGMQLVRDTIDSMTMIKQRVEGIAENILMLSEQTQQIGEIISTVNDIASQSNMLALNAAVEAARAGEHGKGFSVVAAEVRTLAEQSRQATVQVKGILQEIQKATNTTVMATEEGNKVVEQGTRLVSRTQEAIEQLSSVINESAQRAAQVMAGGRQQTTGVEQIAVAMQNINQAMVQSLASTRQAERAAQNLNELSHGLNEMVKRYAV